MLTEAEKKWLKERRGTLVYHKFCLHCTYVKRRWFDGQTPCLLADIGRICPVFYQDDIQDVAEFEARVAVKLTHSHDELTTCDGFDATCHSETLTCWECRLKHARLAVEAEMEQN